MYFYVIYTTQPNLIPAFILPLVQKPLFPLYLLEVGYILGNLDYALVFALPVSNGKIADKYLAPFQVNPELGRVSFAGFQLADYLLHLVQALGGVAVLNLAADYGWRPPEYAFIAPAVVAHGIGIVNKG